MTKMRRWSISDYGMPLGRKSRWGVMHSRSVDASPSTRYQASYVSTDYGDGWGVALIMSEWMNGTLADEGSGTSRLVRDR